MHVFSTVLFVNGSPIGYKVYKENDRLLLNPSENPYRSILAPVISVQQRNGKWQVEGTGDQDLIDQIIEDVTLNEEKLPFNDLSAAP